MSQNELIQPKYCACANLRGLTRLVTNFYDQTLEPSGLQITQTILMTVLSNLGSATINQLAEALVMDPTTLNRNLKPLEEQGLIEKRTGEDRRSRILALSPKGQDSLNQALPLWEQAQTRIVEGLGVDKYKAFLSSLGEVAALLR